MVRKCYRALSRAANGRQEFRSGVDCNVSNITGDFKVKKVKCKLFANNLMANCSFFRVVRLRKVIFPAFYLLGVKTRYGLVNTWLFFKSWRFVYKSLDKFYCKLSSCDCD